MAKTGSEDDIGRSLDRVAKILSGLLLKDIEEGDQKEKIRRLKGCGLDNSEIATMLGTTANSVNVAVHRLKKARRRKGRNAG